MRFYRFIPRIKVRYWKREEEGEEKKRRGKVKESARKLLGEKKKEKREKSAKSEVEIKLYILNRRGGLRPEGGRFFTLRRLVDAPVLKKNREKNEGKRKRQKTH